MFLRRLKKNKTPKFAKKNLIVFENNLKCKAYSYNLNLRSVGMSGKDGKINGRNNEMNVRGGMYDDHSYFQPSPS